MKYWNGGDVIIKDGVYLHGVCEPNELYVEGRRSIKEAIYFARKLLFPLMNEDFDVIDRQAFPYFPCFSAKICSSLKRTPLVITWHEIWNDYWYDYLGRKGIFGKVVEKMTTHLTDKMIAVSERTKRDLGMIGVRNEIKVIQNGIDFVMIIGDGPSSKVFVLPSIREGFGIVALEANACGLPVITVNHKMNAACDFINNNENGVICELSEEEITEKIFIALDRREDMKRKCVENASGVRLG